MRNWEAVPRDVATKIAEHLQFHQDFYTFGCVCSHWRSSATAATFRAAFDATTTTHDLLHHDHLHHHTVPWLMLPLPHHDNDDNDSDSVCTSFYSMCLRNTYQVRLPESTKHVLSSRAGWLLCFSGSCINLSLFNPFSGSLITPPTPPSYYHYRKNECVLCDKFILSADPADSSDFGILVLFGQPRPSRLYNELRVAVWWNQTTHWLPLSNLVGYRVFEDCCHDLAFYKGEFYAVDASGQVSCLGTCKPPLPPYSRRRRTPRVLAKVPILHYNHFMLYLVNSGESNNDDDCLLVIHRRLTVLHSRTYEESTDPYDGVTSIEEIINENDKEVRTVSFSAYKVDVETGEVDEVHSFGNKAVFLGLNSSFAITASPKHGSNPNCIYFTDSYPSIYYPYYGNKVRDLGIYNFSDKTFESYCYNRDGLSPDVVVDCVTPPIWVEPPAI